MSRFGCSTQSLKYLNIFLTSRKVNMSGLSRFCLIIVLGLSSLNSIVQAATTCPAIDYQDDKRGKVVWRLAGGSTWKDVDNMNGYLAGQDVKVMCDDGRSMEADCYYQPIPIDTYWKPAGIKTFKCCDGVTCNNGGTCVRGVCKCPPSWTGANCQTPICTNACQNGGTCTAPNTCTCLSGKWEGATCETPICPWPCQNNGTCMAPATCSCPPEWTGQVCENTVCNPSCINGGYCNANFKCNCPSNLNGIRCENAILPQMSPSGGSSSGSGSSGSLPPNVISGSGTPASPYMSNQPVVVYRLPGNMHLSSGIKLMDESPGNASTNFTLIDPWHVDLEWKNTTLFNRTSKFFETMIAKMISLAGFGYSKIVISEFRRGSIVVYYEIEVISFETMLNFAAIQASMLSASTMFINSGVFQQQYAGLVNLQDFNCSNITTSLGSSTPMPPGSTYNVNQATVAGSFKVNDNVTLADNRTISSSNWPDDLNDPNSELFKAMVRIFQPILESIFTQAGYKDFSLQITGFRPGSIIADYVVALRSLTQLSEEEIAVKVEQVKQQMVKDGKLPAKGAFSPENVGTIKILASSNKQSTYKIPLADAKNGGNGTSNSTRTAGQGNGSVRVFSPPGHLIIGSCVVSAILAMFCMM